MPASEVAALRPMSQGTNANPHQRNPIANGLGQVGVGSQPSLSQLVGVLIDKSESLPLRLAAASALQQISTNQSAIVPALMVVLKDRRETTEMRMQAFDAYFAIASQSTAFLDDFAVVLGDPAEAIVLRRYAGRALEAIARGVAAKTEAASLTVREAQNRLLTLDHILRAFENGSASQDFEINRTRLAVKAHEDRVALALSSSILKLDHAWKWLVLLLVLLLLPPLLCLPVCSWLIWHDPIGLWRINEKLKLIPGWKLPALAKIPLRLPDYLLVSLFCSHPRVREARLRARIQRLIRQLSLPSARDRETAAASCGSLGPAAAAALPALIHRLRDPHEISTVRQAVVQCLGQIGAQSDEVIPTLIEALRDIPNRLRPLAVRALVRIGEKALSSLMEHLKQPHEKENFRVLVAHTLGAFEQNGQAAVPSLLDTLRNKRETETMRAAVVGALGQIGPGAGAAVADLFEIMHDNKSLSRGAAKALIGIAPLAKPSIIALFEALNQDRSNDPEEILATFRLWEIAPPAFPNDTVSLEIYERVRQAVDEGLKQVKVRHNSILGLGNNSMARSPKVEKSLADVVIPLPTEATKKGRAGGGF
jgi:HEAT repeat protein